MIAPIHLNNQFFLQTNEICNIIVNNILPPEFDT